MADAHCPLEVNAVLADQDIKVGIIVRPGERIIWDWLLNCCTWDTTKCCSRQGRFEE